MIDGGIDGLYIGCAVCSTCGAAHGTEAADRPDQTPRHGPPDSRAIPFKPAYRPRRRALEDLDVAFELKRWSKDRISDEFGILHAVPRDEWIVGTPSHRRDGGVLSSAPSGGRFNGSAAARGTRPSL